MRSVDSWAGSHAGRPEHAPCHGPNCRRAPEPTAPPISSDRTLGGEKTLPVAWATPSDLNDRNAVARCKSQGASAERLCSASGSSTASCLATRSLRLYPSTGAPLAARMRVGASCSHRRFRSFPRDSRMLDSPLPANTPTLTEKKKYVRAVGPRLRVLLYFIFGLVALLGANSAYLVGSDRSRMVQRANLPELLLPVHVPGPPGAGADARRAVCGVRHGPHVGNAQRAAIAARCASAMRCSPCRSQCW